MNVCVLCNKPTSLTFCFANSKTDRPFKYLDYDQMAHLECYIDLCVEESIKKVKQKTGEHLNN